MMKRILRNQSGFTLIEMLIVIIIMGILAMVIIPQVGVSTDDAKLNTMQTNLLTLRNALELYYAQHNSRYPGAYLAGDGTTPTNNGTCPQAFEEQLTHYTDINGKISTTRDSTFRYGPYLKAKELPANPFNDDHKVKCDVNIADITDRTADSSTGWFVHTKTGVFFANDGGAGHNEL